MAACAEATPLRVSPMGGNGGRPLDAPHAFRGTDGNVRILLAERLDKRLWVLNTNGTGTSAVDTGHKLSGSPPVIDGGAVLLAPVIFTDNAELRLFDLALVNPAQLGGNLMSGFGDHQFPAVAYRGTSSGQEDIATFLVPAPKGLNQWSAQGDGAASSVALFEDNLNGASHTGGVAVSCDGTYAALNAATALSQVSVSTKLRNVVSTVGTPVGAPVFSRHNGVDHLAAIRAQVLTVYLAGTGQPLANLSLGADPTGSPAVAWLQPGTVARPHAVVPVGTQLQALAMGVPAGPTPPTVVATGNANLGGVVAVRFSGETTDTLLAGDTAGNVHAFHNGTERAGWPVAAGGPITRTPLLLPLDNGRLGLAVVLDGNTTERLVIFTLGPNSAQASLTWPEYQHDAGNLGCADFDPISAP